MRTISAAAAAARAARAQADFCRVLVKDSGGTWRDLTTYGGVNPILTVNWSESVSDPHRTAEVTLQREHFKISYSPWMSASPINKGFNPAASAVALLKEHREFKVDVAVMPMDRQPSSGDWFTVFHGRIDTIDPVAGLRFSGRDLAGRIADQQLKKEYVYSFATDGGVAVALRPWEPGMVAVLNEYVLPQSRGDNDPGQGRFYKCTTAGTAANSEPTWPTSGTVADGTAVWTYVGTTSSVGRPVEQVIQNILDKAKSTGDTTVTLYTPSSPGWAITEFVQSRDKALPAVRALALQIGWDARMKWRAATSQFEFTLFEPERTKTTADYTLAASDYGLIKRFETNIDRKRNSWTIKYSDSADLWPDGTAKRKEISVSDIAPGDPELWAEINEGSASNINTVTEATRMVNSALADSKDPIAELAVDTALGFPWAECGDLYQFAADGLTFDSAQKMAIAKFSNSFAEGKLRTTLELSGKPSLGADRWIQGATDQPILTIVAAVLGNGMAKTSGLVAFTGPKTVRPQAIQVPGGLDVVLVDSTKDKQREGMEYEVHVSTSSAFTPDSTTLKAVTKAERVSLQGFKPGQAMVVRAVPRMLSRGRVVRGQPSKEVASSAGRVKAGLIDRIAVAAGIPNSDFKDIYDPDPENSLTPPEHWTLDSGTFGPTGDARNTNDATYGMVLELRQTGTNAILKSPVYRLRMGATDALLALRVKQTGTQSAGRNLHVEITYYSDSAGVTSVGSYDTVVPNAFAAVNTWAVYTENIVVPAGATYARVRFYKDATSSAFGWAVGNIDIAENRTGDASFSRVRAKTATAGSYANGATVIFGTEDRDSRSEYDNATGIFTATVAGTYQVLAQIWVDFAAYAAGNAIYLQLQKNGATFVAYGSRSFAPTTATWFLTSNLETTVQLAAGDNLRIVIGHSRAGNVSLYPDNNANYWTIDRIA